METFWLDFMIAYFPFLLINSISGALSLAPEHRG